MAGTVRPLRDGEVQALSQSWIMSLVGFACLLVLAAIMAGQTRRKAEGPISSPSNVEPDFYDSDDVQTVQAAVRKVARQGDLWDASASEDCSDQGVDNDSDYEEGDTLSSCVACQGLIALVEAAIAAADKEVLLQKRNKMRTPKTRWSLSLSP